MARVWRDGQKRKIYIYRLLTTVSQSIVKCMLVECMYMYQILYNSLKI